MKAPSGSLADTNETKTKKIISRIPLTNHSKSVDESPQRQVYSLIFLDWFLYLVALSSVFPVGEWFRFFSCVVGLPLANYAKFYSIITACATSAVLTVAMLHKITRPSFTGDVSLHLKLVGALIMAFLATLIAAVSYVYFMYWDYPNPFFNPYSPPYTIFHLHFLFLLLTLLFIWMFFADVQEINKTRRTLSTSTIAAATERDMAVTLSPLTVTETVTGILSFDLPDLPTLLVAAAFLGVTTPPALLLFRAWRRKGAKQPLYMGTGFMVVAFSLVVNMVAYYTRDVVSLFLVWLLPTLGLILLYYALFPPAFHA